MECWLQRQEKLDIHSPLFFPPTLLPYIVIFCHVFFFVFWSLFTSTLPIFTILDRCQACNTSHCHYSSKAAICQSSNSNIWRSPKLSIQKGDPHMLLLWHIFGISESTPWLPSSWSQHSGNLIRTFLDSKLQHKGSQAHTYPQCCMMCNWPLTSASVEFIWAVNAFYFAFESLVLGRFVLHSSLCCHYSYSRPRLILWTQFT